MQVVNLSTPASKESEASGQVRLFHQSSDLLFIFWNAMVAYMFSNLSAKLQPPQGAQEGRGTPGHMTANACGAPRNDTVARSIGREIANMKKSIDGISLWREGVDCQMTQQMDDMAQQKQDMASVNKKLDLLLSAMLPSGGREPVRQPPLDTTAEPVSKTACNEVHDDIITTRCASASGMTEDLSAMNRLSPLPGKITTEY